MPRHWPPTPHPGCGATTQFMLSPLGMRGRPRPPSRYATAIALLACSRNGYVCCPSLHRGHRVGEIIALVDRMRAAAVIAQPGFGIDADEHDLFAQLADRDFLREIYR